MIILFLMMLCTTVCVHGMNETLDMNATLDQKEGQLIITSFDRIYSNRVIENKKGTTISSAAHPLCLMGTFIPIDQGHPSEEVMLPIEAINPQVIPDNAQVTFAEHKTNKMVCTTMSSLLRAKIREALGK